MKISKGLSLTLKFIKGQLCLNIYFFINIYLFQNINIMKIQISQESLHDFKSHKITPFDLVKSLSYMFNFQLNYTYIFLNLVCTITTYTIKSNLFPKPKSLNNLFYSTAQCTNVVVLKLCKLS